MIIGKLSRIIRQEVPYTQHKDAEVVTTASGNSISVDPNRRIGDFTPTRLVFFRYAGGNASYTDLVIKERTSAKSSVDIVMKAIGPENVHFHEIQSDGFHIEPGDKEILLFALAVDGNKNFVPLHTNDTFFPPIQLLDLEGKKALEGSLPINIRDSFDLKRLGKHDPRVVFAPFEISFRGVSFKVMRIDFKGNGINVVSDDKSPTGAISTINRLRQQNVNESSPRKKLLKVTRNSYQEDERTNVQKRTKEFTDGSKSTLTIVKRSDGVVIFQRDQTNSFGERIYSTREKRADGNIIRRFGEISPNNIAKKARMVNSFDSTVTNESSFGDTTYSTQLKRFPNGDVVTITKEIHGNSGSLLITQKQGLMGDIELQSELKVHDGTNTYVFNRGNVIKADHRTQLASQNVLINGISRPLLLDREADFSHTILLLPYSLSSALRADSQLKDHKIHTFYYPIKDYELSNPDSLKDLSKLPFSLKFHELPQSDRALSESALFKFAKYLTNSAIKIEIPKGLGSCFAPSLYPRLPHAPSLIEPGGSFVLPVLGGHSVRVDLGTGSLEMTFIAKPKENIEGGQEQITPINDQITEGTATLIEVQKDFNSPEE